MYLIFFILILFLFLLIYYYLINLEFYTNINIKTSLVLIHIGNKYPIYIFDCIHQFRIFNKNVKLYLLVEQSIFDLIKNKFIPTRFQQIFEMIYNTTIELSYANINKEGKHFFKAKM